MKILYIDEAGVYTQNVSRLDPNNPIFLIAGIIIDKKYDNALHKEFVKLKLKYFKRESIIFHALEFTHPKRSKQPGMAQFAEANFRKQFYVDINRILSKIPFGICGFAAYTEEYIKFFKGSAPDPYELGVELAFSTLIEQLGDNEQAKIFAEARANPKMNETIINKWKIETQKYQRVGIVSSDMMLKHSVFKPEFREKSYDMSGLELVDLIAYQFSRGLAGKSAKGLENEISPHLINSKIIHYYSLPAHPQFYLKKQG